MIMHKIKYRNPIHTELTECKKAITASSVYMSLPSHSPIFFKQVVKLHLDNGNIRK